MKIGQTFEIAYAHRILNHPGKCRNLHGHNGRVEVTIEGQLKILTGMVMDFSELKSLVNSTILDSLDHSTILQDSDGLVGSLKAEVTTKLVILAIPPTAEVITSYILNELVKCSRERKLESITVRFWESQYCYAEDSWTA